MTGKKTGCVTYLDPAPSRPDQSSAFTFPPCSLTKKKKEGEENTDYQKSTLLLLIKAGIAARAHLCMKEQLDEQV